MARGKRHHTVTRALLEGFALNNQVVVRRRNGSEIKTSVRNATVVSDFYAFEREHHHDDAVEQWLANDVESPFAHLLSALRSGSPPSISDRPVIVRFIATAAVRTRTTRDYIKQVDPHIAPMVVLQTVAPRMGWDLSKMSALEIEGLLTICQDFWREAADEKDQKLSLLRTIVRHSQALEKDLKGYAWSILRTSGPRLLIGDAPILAISGYERGWHGLIPKGSTVFLPIAPDKILIGEPHAFGLSRSGDDLATTVNALTAREAHADVFRHPEMPWPEAVHFGSGAPELPTPSRTLRPSPPGAPSTFPSTYPAVDDEKIATLLEYLQAADTVT